MTLIRLLICSFYVACMLNNNNALYCNSFTIISTTAIQSNRRTTFTQQDNKIIRQKKQQQTSLNLVSVKRTAIFDGSEWTSIKNCLLEEEQQRKKGSSNHISKMLQSTDVGYMNVVGGEIIDDDNKEQKRRVIGIEAPNKPEDIDPYIKLITLDDNTRIYKDSMAILPDNNKNIKFDDAITTLIASLSGIHCSLPTPALVGIGGSDDEFFSPINNNNGDDDDDGMKAVVMGGSNYAKFIAEGLATIIDCYSDNDDKSSSSSSSVSLVTTRKGVKVNNKLVNVIGPSVGESQEGFASSIGKFDVLIDTMTDESKGGKTSLMQRMASSSSSEDDDDDDDELDDDIMLLFDSMGSGIVLRELQRQNQCNKYVSTFTKSQRIVKDGGAIFGPGKVDKYHNDMVNSIMKKDGSSNKCYLPKVPKGFSKTIQTLIDNNVVFGTGAKDTYKIKNNNISIRNWSLQDFWELASWPRDSSGGSSVRFGLPVLEYEDDDEDINVDEPMIQAERELEKEQIQQEQEQGGGLNANVVTIDDLSDLTREIVNPGKDGVLFLSSAYCRTCKYLSPKYARMAKQSADDKVTSSMTGGGGSGNDDDFVFAKAVIGGDSNKALRAVLKVNTVPTFIFYKDGERYGEPLSISKMPSKKLNLAIEYIQANKEWDSNAIESMKF